MEPDAFGRGERVCFVLETLSPVDGHLLAAPGDCGTVIFREPLASYEVYHVRLDAPHDTLYTEMLVTPKYLKAET